MNFKGTGKLSLTCGNFNFDELVKTYNEQLCDTAAINNLSIISGGYNPVI